MPIANTNLNTAHVWARTFENCVRRYFLLLLIASYCLAAFAPSLGYWLRSVQWRPDVGFQSTISLSRLLLAFLLFLAGLSIDLRQLWNSICKPIPLGCSLLAKLLVPTSVVFLLATVGSLVNVQPHFSEMMLGLALVAAMPAAGSSPTWTQKSGGDVALALGIVVGSTLMGPWFGGMWLGHLAERVGQIDESVVRQISTAVFGTFFLSWVLIPSIIGIAARYLLGRDRIKGLRPYVRLLGSSILLLLIYAFAATSLSKVIEHNQLGQLFWAFGLAAFLCTVNFLAGWLTGRAIHAEPSTRMAMLFGIGMHNNGIALLVADSILRSESPAFLPIIAYALSQHLIAGMADALMMWRREKPLANRQTVGQRTEAATTAFPE